MICPNILSREESGPQGNGSVSRNSYRAVYCGTIIIRDAVAHLSYPVPLLELSSLIPVAGVG